MNPKTEKNGISLKAILATAEMLKAMPLLLGLMASIPAMAQESAPPAVAPVLFNEEGRPRCGIESWPGEFLPLQRLGHFVEEWGDSAAELRPCEERDFLYAAIVLAPQDIQIAGMPAPGKALPLFFTFGNLTIACAAGFGLLDTPREVRAQKVRRASAVAASGTLSIALLANKSLQTVLARPWITLGTQGLLMVAYYHLCRDRWWAKLNMGK